MSFVTIDTVNRILIDSDFIHKLPEVIWDTDDFIVRAISKPLIHKPMEIRSLTNQIIEAYSLHNKTILKNLFKFNLWAIKENLTPNMSNMLHTQCLDKFIFYDGQDFKNKYHDDLKNMYERHKCLL